MCQASDEGLLADFLGGEEKAFEQLVRRYEKPLLSFLFRYLGEIQEAEEVFQEAFIRVYTKGDRFDPGKKFKTWLYTIALNLARTAFKRRRIAPLLAREEGSGGGQDKIVLEGQAPEEYSPEKKHENRELGESVEGALSSLPQRQREVFVLFQYQGLSYAEISTVLGRPLGTIKSQMHYAILALRDKLRETYPQA
jgi:RNA polymerase sigma-70 factor (ECF subfamily)